MKKIGEVEIIKGDETVVNKSIWGKVFRGDVGIWEMVYFNIKEIIFNRSLRDIIDEYNKNNRYRIKIKHKKNYGEMRVRCYIARPKEEKMMPEILEELDGFECKKEGWKMKIKINKKDFDYVFKHEVMKAI